MKELKLKSLYIEHKIEILVQRAVIAAAGVLVLKVITSHLYALSHGYLWNWKHMFAGIYTMDFNIPQVDFIAMNNDVILINFIFTGIVMLLVFLLNRKKRTVWVDVFYLALVWQSLHYYMAFISSIVYETRASGNPFWLITSLFFFSSVIYFIRYGKSFLEFA